MSSIGKITSSLLSVPTELTVAAANLNFDFSLVKVEAPKEYYGVRDALSKGRRDKAESGPSHITARKLGALFDPLVPPIPNLVSAYGQRVSQISSKLSTESSSTATTAFGLFSSQAGPDATNIWAAATSGRGAIAVQLLACMLARIWNEAEAISLWVELVERRVNEVKESTVDGSNLATLMAAQQIFSREQLAAWDSSARSWIKTADAERQIQQKQLMLILNNIELPVNSSHDLYDSVVMAWKSAMTAMEKLVQGIPQQIRDGSTLLAISAWHLYPDMAVLSDVMTRIEQHDTLMKGSLLTFSVHVSSANEDSHGIFWSLPMAHMRYYSTPIVAHGRLNSDTSRVSMDDFLIVILGMVISPWLRSFCSDTSRCCRLVSLLWSLTKRGYSHFQHAPALQGLEWLSMLSGAADRCLSASGVLGQHHQKLLSLGIRSRGKFFAGTHTMDAPGFGLTSYTRLLGLIKDDNIEEKVGLLRRIAQSLKPNSEEILISYARSPAPTKTQVNSLNSEFMNSVEFASVLPVRRSTQKRSADGEAHAVEGHCRWVQGRWVEGSTSCDDLPTIHERGAKCGFECAICFNSAQKDRIEALGEELRWYNDKDIRHSFDAFLWVGTGRDRGLPAELYSLVLGDPKSFSIYKSERCRFYGSPNVSKAGYGSTTHEREDQATIDEVEAILESPCLSLSLLLESLQSWVRQSKTGDHLNAMVFASTLYQRLPGATVSLEVLKIPLVDAGWSQVVSSAMKNDADWSHVSSYPSKCIKSLTTFFSCLAMFESGQFVIDAGHLTGVMAMSSYDSIFVASALMSDPQEDNSQQPIRRVFGNIGRSEMAFMFPVADPRFKEADAGSWHMINHSPFDGQLLDSFKGTSLHLSLTDFELALDVGARGLRHRHAVLLECVITVNDKGMDLGDLNILSAFDSHLLTWAGPCSHRVDGEQQETGADPSYVSETGVAHSRQDALMDAKLTSLDCWDELLDPPTTSKSIFRATGNWQARLAAMAAGVQKGQSVRLLPKSPCLRCIAESGHGSDEFDVLIA